MNKIMTLILTIIIFVTFVVKVLTAEERSLSRIKVPEEEYKSFGPLRDIYFGNFKLSSRFHTRISSNNSSNLADLDNDVDDSIYYLGYQYDVSLSLKHTSTAEFFLQLKRDNISEYDSPLLLDDKLTTLFGTRHEYTKAEFLPRISRLYFDVPVTNFLDMRMRFGFFPYLVGNGYALGGKYPDLGATLSLGPENLRGRLHYHRVDFYNKQNWGPEISRDDEGSFNGRNTNADFYAADFMIKVGRHSIQPYLGFLHDYTSQIHRANNFDNFKLNGTKVNDDLLGTVGVDINLNFERFNFGIEFARNFGEANSADKTSPDRDDITHKGWLLVADANYNLGILRPKGKFVWASGPTSRRQDLLDARYRSRNNRTFSVYTPTNTNTFDAHYQRTGIGPYLATASTYLFNFGIDRPGIFNDPFVIENILFFNGGVEFFPIDKTYISLDYWNMHADEPGFGLNSAGRAEKLPSELGHEIDFFASYAVTRRLSINLQMGYFFPGKYYREERGDTFARGNLGFSPVLPRNGQGDPDDAFLMAVGLEYSF